MRNTTLLPSTAHFLDFKSLERALEWYSRGVPRMFLGLGNSVYSYEAEPVIQAAEALPRSIEQRARRLGRERCERGIGENRAREGLHEDLAMPALEHDGKPRQRGIAREFGGGEQRGGGIAGDRYGPADREPARRRDAEIGRAHV